MKTEFRPIQLEDKEWVERCRDPKEHPFSALTFPSLFMWKDDYGLTISGDDDFFVIHSKENNGFFAPCGDPDKCLGFLHDTFQKDKQIRVLYVTKEQAFQAQAAGFRARYSPELSEYICSTKALALKEGHISATYRKKVSRFSRDFAYTAKVIRQEDIPELLSIVSDWDKDVEKTGRLDLSAARLSLENYEALGLSGIVLHTRDQIAAFSFGFESAPDIYTMSTVKYDKQLSPSVTLVCTKEEAEQVVLSRYPFCNLEEDLGYPGLRDAKLQCSPVKMQEVFILER